MKHILDTSLRILPITKIGKLFSHHRDLKINKKNSELFLKTQNLAFECAEFIASQIQPGWSEIKTAKLMDCWLQDQGVKSFFHKSFAWFGDRSCFKGFTGYKDFLNSKRVYQEHDAVILDTAPIINDFPADIGFSFYKGEKNLQYDEMKAFLLTLRGEIPKLVASNKNLGMVWQKIDQLIIENGYRNCHKEYPFNVLGHKLFKVPFGHIPSILAPFGWQTYWSLLSRGLLDQLLDENHQEEKTGYWAIEPHIGNDHFGMKFEEILVIKENKVEWLSDNVPHLRK